MPNAQLSLSPSDQLMRSPLTKTVALMWTVHDTSPSHSLSFSLSLSVSPVSHSPFPAIPAPFAPSLPSTVPPATFVPFKVANDCRSFSLLSTLEFSPPLALSLCPFLPSQPPMNAFFFLFSSFLLLTVNSMVPPKPQALECNKKLYFYCL